MRNNIKMDIKNIGWEGWTRDVLDQRRDKLGLW
jgi:hypothetical protein